MQSCAAGSVIPLLAQTLKSSHAASYAMACASGPKSAAFLNSRVSQTIHGLAIAEGETHLWS